MLRSLTTFLSALSQSQLERLGSGVMLFAASFVSPSWMLLNSTLKPYIDIRALNDPQAAPQVILHFMQVMHANPNQVTEHLIPSLLLCLLVSLGFLCLSTAAGKYLTRLLIQNYRAKQTSV